MSLDTSITVRLDRETKLECERLFKSLGFDTVTAVRMFLVKSLECRGIPFPLVKGEDETND